jgi:hypothetical protein
MRRSKRLFNSFLDELTVRGDGNTTKVFMIQGLDLTFRQTKADGEEAHLSHYSDPGTYTFLILLKFLYVSGVPIPEIKKLDRPGSDAWDDSAPFLGRIVGGHAFPIKYGVQLPGTRNTLAWIDRDSIYNPILNLEGYGGTLTFSLSTAGRMLTTIQSLYPTLGNFHLATQEFLEEAANHPEQIVDVPALRRSKPKQLEFPFMKELRRQEKEVKQKAKS